MPQLPRATSTDLPRSTNLPRHGFGASGLGNLGRSLSDTAAQRVLRTAWQAGYRYFDTSPLYGYGLSELRLGQFLRGRPRDQFTLSTKVGRYLVPPRGRPIDTGIWAPPLGLSPVLDYGYDGTMRALEQSHSRLGLSDIDVVYIHDIDRRCHGADFAHHYRAAVDGAYRALDELRSGGFVKAIGIGVNDADAAADFMRDADLDVVMLAGKYTLIDQSALTDCFPTALRRNVSIVAAGVFNSGILAKGPRLGATYDYGLAPDDVISRVAKIEAICAEYAVPLPAAAAQFPLAHAAVTTVVLGMSRPENVVLSAELLAWKIPPALWLELKSEGLLPQEAPVPA